MSDDLIHDAQADTSIDQAQRVHERQRQQCHEKGADVPALVVETHDERQQVSAERENPEKGNHSDVHRHLVRRCQQQSRAARRKRQPQ